MVFVKKFFFFQALENLGNENIKQLNNLLSPEVLKKWVFEQAPTPSRILKTFNTKSSGIP